VTTQSRIGVFVDEDGRVWGVPREDRRNRSTVRLLLALSRKRRLRVRPAYVAYELLRNAVARLHASDFRTRDFGSDLFLPHPFAIVVHARAVIGDRVTIFQGVTLGESGTRPGAPTIGDDVVIGAGAALLGPITVGDGAVVGANAVVTVDVPAGGLAVGNPAQIIPG
jgi:serine O-acetyltransferase